MGYAQFRVVNPTHASDTLEFFSASKASEYMQELAEFGYAPRLEKWSNDANEWTEVKFDQWSELDEL